MQTHEVSTEVMANEDEDENASASKKRPASVVMPAKRRSSHEATPRVYDSDRFKLVQRRRGAASPGHVLPALDSPCTHHVHRDMDRPREAAPPPPAAAMAVEKTKKEPTPQPVVPDTILEAYVDAQGYVKTRTYVRGKFLGKVGCYLHWNRLKAKKRC